MILQDYRRFGPGFIGHHFRRYRDDSVTTVEVPGIGPIHVRPRNSDIETVRQVFGGRDYDISHPAALAKRIADHYQGILDRGLKPIIVDAGANIGAATLWFHQQYPAASIVAVEPDPGNATILRMNVAGIEICTVLQAAIGAERGFVELTTGGSGWAVTSTRADQGVKTVVIEDAFAESGGDTPFIVKIDIEGFEKDLFSSNLDWLEQAFMVVLEPHDWMFPGELTSRSFQQAMAKHPFEMFMKGENLFYVRV